MTGKDHLGGVKVASAKESPFQELPHFPDTTTQRHRELLEPSQDTVSSSSDSVWQRTVEQCAKSIVSIKGIRNRCFDTDTPSNFAATGFVVDAERGIILTNRHVVSGGPTTAQAVLSNHEQIDLVPIYRDPVHDFGFFKYDMENVRFLDIPGIELYPDGARVGMEIRVIGNNDNERLTILSGMLARLDRQAPDYGEGEYNDFNIFYMQAASGTASGASGSPVLDIQGRAIALHAGGRDQHSSFYLPLRRVQHALRCIQQGKHVPRGTIQTEFVYKSYYELMQLGLPDEYEAKLRSSSKGSGQHHGMLVVRKTLPDGPAHGLLEPGDILFGTKLRLLRDFDTLEDILDSSIGQTVQLYVMRAGILKKVAVQVQDLHSITPSRYIEFGGGIVHDLSYQMAHSYGLSLKNAGVYVAAGGYLLGRARATRGAVIVSLNYKPINNLDDFVSIVKTIPEGAQVPIRYYRPPAQSPRKAVMFIMQMDRKWNPFLLVSRNDKTGLWDFKDLETSSPQQQKQKLTKPVDSGGGRVNNCCSSAVYNVADSVESLPKALCSVECYAPIVIDGMRDSHTFGTGVVLSLDPPLVLCDRDTVPVGICSLTLKFNNSLTVPGNLLFLHPFYNFAVISFDVKTVLSANLDIRFVKLADGPLKLNDVAYYVALDGDDKPEVQETHIAKHIKGIRTRECLPPRYRACNMDAYKPSEQCDGQGGLLANKNGHMVAHWQTVVTGDSKFGGASREMFGVAIKYIQPAIDALRARKKPQVRGIDVELWTMQTANARLLGLPEEWLAGKDGVLYVVSILNRSTPSGSTLQLNDIVLEMQGRSVTDVSCLADFVETEQIDMTIFRNGEIMRLSFATSVYDGQETTHVVGWQGLHLQQIYPAAREQFDLHGSSSSSVVLASCCLFGSPAQGHVPPNVIVAEINGQEIETLQDFIRVVEENKQQKFARVKYITSRGQMDVCAFQLDYHYWPTWQVHKDTGLIRQYNKA